MPFVQTTFLILLRRSGGHTFPKLCWSMRGPAKDMHAKTLITFTTMHILTRISRDLQEHLNTLITQFYLGSTKFEIPIPLFTIKAISPFKADNWKLKYTFNPWKNWYYDSLLSSWLLVILIIIPCISAALDFFFPKPVQKHTFIWFSQQARTAILFSLFYRWLLSNLS